MVQWHSGITSERSQTYCQRTMFTPFSRNSDGCNICIPFLGFEGTICSVSSLLFWSGAWKTTTEIWTVSLLHGNIMYVTVRPTGQPWAGGFITVVSVLHDKHSSSPPVVLPHIHFTLRLKSKTTPHTPPRFLPAIRRRLTFWQLWSPGVLLDY